MKTRFLLIALCVLSIAQSKPSSHWSEWSDRQRDEQGEDMAVTFTIWSNVAADRDFNNAANWTGIVPTDADHTAIFDGSVTQTGPTVNMDRGANSFGVRTMPGYTGGIGTTAAPLFWTPAALHVNCNHNRGTAYLALKAASVGAIFQKGSGEIVLATTSVGSGLFFVTNGLLTVTASADLDGSDLYVGGDHAEVVIAAGTGTAYMVDSLDITAGLVTCARDANVAATGGSTTIRVSSRGRVLYTGDWGNKTETIVDMYGGYLKYTPATQSAVLADTNIYGGTLDLSDNSLPVLTNLYTVGPHASVVGGPGEPNGPVVLFDLREDYP